MTAIKDQPLNYFELRLRDGVAEGKHTSDGTATLYTDIWIDGHHVDEPHPIDLPELILSCYIERWYDIYTCGCGVGMCAGIVDGIHVTHPEGMIQWSLRRPQSAGDLSDATLDEWEKIAIPMDFTFDRAQMLIAIKTYLTEVKSLVGSHPERFDYPILNHTAQSVMNLDPDHPSCQLY